MRTMISPKRNRPMCGSPLWIRLSVNTPWLRWIPVFWRQTIWCTMWTPRWRRRSASSTLCRATRPQRFRSSTRATSALWQSSAMPGPAIPLPPRPRPSNMPRWICPYLILICAISPRTKEMWIRFPRLCRRWPRRIWLWKWWMTRRTDRPFSTAWAISILTSWSAVCWTSTRWTWNWPVPRWPIRRPSESSRMWNINIRSSPAAMGSTAM